MVNKQYNKGKLLGLELPQLILLAIRFFVKITFADRPKPAHTR